MAAEEGPAAWVRCYQAEDGTAYAEGRETTYEGSDLLDAAQQAIDAKLEAEGGFVHLQIEPDIYPVSTPLSVTQKGAAAISIESTGTHAAYLQTRGTEDSDGIPDGETVIAFDPDAGGEASARMRGIEIRGLFIDDRQPSNIAVRSDSGGGEPRLDGIYINDAHQAIVERVILRPFRTALSIQNTWQGRVNNINISGSGHEPTESPCIEVIGGASPNSEFPWTNWPGTQNASNHIQLNHIQGHTDSYHFLEVRRIENRMGAAHQCEINFANLELQSSDYPGIRFINGGPKWIVKGCIFKGGSPSIKATGQSHLVIGNCYQEKAGQLLRADGADRVVVSNCMAEGGPGEEAPDLLSVTDANLVASNFWGRGGRRAIDLDGPGEAVISNCSFRNMRESGVRIENPGGEQILSNIRLSGVGSATDSYGFEVVDAEQPVIIDDSTVAYAGDNGNTAAIRRHNSPHVRIGEVLPWENVAEEMTTTN
jgi:hypothetical protein